MLSHNQWDLLDPNWNIDGVLVTIAIAITEHEHFTGLGWNEKMASTKLNNAYLLHWSGRSEHIIIIMTNFKMCVHRETMVTRWIILVLLVTT